MPVAKYKHAGQPPYFKDGNYHEEEINSLLYNHFDFSNEQEFQQHFVKNIDYLLSDHIIKIKEEVTLPPKQSRRRSKFRLDIVAISENNHYIIECKVPSCNAVTDLVCGAAQLQLYGLIYQRWVGIRPKLFLACSKINQFLTEYIQIYTPDINLLICGKDYTIGLYGKTATI